MKTNDIEEGLSPSDKAVMLDIHVRTGTANVLQQRQWLRYMYAGSSICECSLTLNKGDTVADENSYSLLCLTTSAPIKVAFTDEGFNRHTLKVNRALVLDSPISEIIIMNEGMDSVTVNLTKLK